MYLAKLVAVQNDWYEFTDVLECMLNYQAAPEKVRTPGESISPFHTAGSLQRALSIGPSLPAADVERWAADPDHGLLHGLATAFYALFYKHLGKWGYRADDEVLVASCLVHDYLKSVGHPENHDANLRKLFPALRAITYSHSHPESARHPLVVGDRIESLRHLSHDERWADPNRLGEYLTTPARREFVGSHHRYFRPALSRIFAGRRDVWIRHGIVSDSISAKASTHGDGVVGAMETVEVPGIHPSLYWAPYPGYWCVEIGALPFGMNITRDVNTFRPLPVISLTNFRKWSSAPIRTIRDHQCASGRVPLSEWTCLLCHDDLKRPERRSLLENCGGVVDLKLANRLLALSQHIITILTVLRCQALGTE